MNLSADEQKRYARQLILKKFGEKGQLALKKARVLVIGTGGLGSPICYYLAAAGVGHLGVADFDVVDDSNLQRQILHNTGDLGVKKVVSAQKKLTALNPYIKIETFEDKVTAENIGDLIETFDFIIDGTDTFDAKYLINDACVIHNKPFCHGSVMQYDGQMITVLPKKTACFRCVFEKKPAAGSVPSAAEAGVLGAVPGVFGSLQAIEAVKYLINEGDLLTNRLLIHDSLHMIFQTIKVKPNSGCPVCGDHPTITSLT